MSFLLIYRGGIVASLFAIFLQTAVFLQNLLPEHYQIAQICQQINDAINDNHSEHHHLKSLLEHGQHSAPLADHASSSPIHDHQHQCQYCTVHANLVVPTDFGIDEVFDRFQIRWLWFQLQVKYLLHIFQRFFILPQGRAPPNIIFA